MGAGAGTGATGAVCGAAGGMGATGAVRGVAGAAGAAGRPPGPGGRAMPVGGRIRPDFGSSGPPRGFSSTFASVPSRMRGAVGFSRSTCEESAYTARSSGIVTPANPRELFTNVSGVCVISRSCTSAGNDSIAYTAASARGVQLASVNAVVPACVPDLSVSDAITRTAMGPSICSRASATSAGGASGSFAVRSIASSSSGRKCPAGRPKMRSRPSVGPPPSRLSTMPGMRSTPSASARAACTL